MSQRQTCPRASEETEPEVASIPVERISREIEKLTAQMFKATSDLEFGKAAELRDLIRAREQKQIKYGSP
jgi:excinuclease UvrABC helicase subunit UvrB